MKCNRLKRRLRKEVIKMNCKNSKRKPRKEIPMRKIFACIFAVFLSMSLYVNTCVAVDKVTVLEWSMFVPAQSPGSLLLIECVKNLEKATNGRIKVNIHFGGTLTPPTQTFDSTVKGIADIGSASTGMTPGRFPLLEVMDLPWGTRYAQTAAVLARDLVNHFRPKEFEKVKVVELDGNAPMLIHTNKPVRSLEDLKGMKLRVPGGLSINIVKALGAIPLVIPAGETYDALKKGVVDGIVAGNSALDLFKFGEVTKYTTLNYRTGIGGSGYTVMNLDKWNSLSEEDKKIFDRWSADYIDKLAKLFDRMDADARTLCEQKGHQFIQLSESEEDRWAAKIAPLYDDYVKDKSAKGIPAAEVIKFCRDWVKQHVK
jgi:TRAP-type transport system periplasmic protein